MQTPLPTDLTDLAVLFSPAIAAPIVRWAANVFSSKLGGKPPLWGLGLAFLIEGGLALVLFAPITPEVILRGVLYSIFAFVGAFGLNEYLAARTLTNSPSARMVSGPKPTLPPGSWMAR
jgi:hypothetical protein